MTLLLRIQKKTQSKACTALTAGLLGCLSGDLTYTMLGANLSDQIPGGPNLTLTLTLTLNSN